MPPGDPRSGNRRNIIPSTSAGKTRPPAPHRQTQSRSPAPKAGKKFGSEAQRLGCWADGAGRTHHCAARARRGGALPHRHLACGRGAPVLARTPRESRHRRRPTKGDRPVIELTAPLQKQDIKRLKVGDVVYLSGKIIMKGCDIEYAKWRIHNILCPGHPRPRPSKTEDKCQKLKG